MFLNISCNEPALKKECISFVWSLCMTGTNQSIIRLMVFEVGPVYKVYQKPFSPMIYVLWTEVDSAS
jgi:hypothetical protein